MKTEFANDIILGMGQLYYRSTGLDEGTQKKPGRWVKEKYFHAIGQRNWVFCGEVEEQDGTIRKVQLFYAHTVPIEWHTKIKGEANPYDLA